MASRKKLIQLLIYFFSSFNFSFSDIIIKNNTEWLRNKNITQNVIVKPGATLTIKEDVSIYIHNENKESENSGIQFIISGTLKIMGSRQNPIFIGPKLKSNDKNYWQGLKFDSTQSGSVIEFLELSNATNALDIRSPIKVTNSTIKSSGGNALSINSENSNISARCCFWSHSFCFSRCFSSASSINLLAASGPASYFQKSSCRKPSS